MKKKTDVIDEMIKATTKKIDNPRIFGRWIQRLLNLNQNFCLLKKKTNLKFWWTIHEFYFLEKFSASQFSKDAIVKYCFERDFSNIMNGKQSAAFEKNSFQINDLLKTKILKNNT